MEPAQAILALVVGSGYLVCGASICPANHSRISSRCYGLRSVSMSLSLIDAPLCVELT